MSLDAWIVLGLLATMIVVFVTDKLPPEVVAIGGMLVLLLSGILTAPEALGGFSNPATVTVAAMLILSAGLQKTGALSALSGILTRTARWPRFMLLIITVFTGAISAFVNNTAAVAVLLPAVLLAAKKNNFPASKYLIPLSYASQFGGVCTLIGTSTNLLVNSVAQSAGLPGFTMFELGRLGLIFFVVGTLYLWILGPWLLPARRAIEMVDRYGLGEYFTEFRIKAASSLVGRLYADLQKRSPGIKLVDIVRGVEHLGSSPDIVLLANDVLLVRGDAKSLMDLRERSGLVLNPEFKMRDAALQGSDLMLAEAIVAPGAPFCGLTLGDLHFGHEHELAVLAIQRHGAVLRDRLAQTPLEIGDIFLVLGSREAVHKLTQERDFILLGEVTAPKLTRGRVPRALAIMVGVVALPALGIIDILPSSIIGCLAMWGTGCLKTEEVFESVQWRVIMLLAAMIPLGIAMEKTGTAEWLASGLFSLGGYSPLMALGALYLSTALLTGFISNNATAVLLGPIAIGAAHNLGVSPQPFLVAVAFAASTSFATPVGYQTNAMVFTAGGYHFTDFARVGLPLNLIFFGIAMWGIPLFWPF